MKAWELENSSVFSADGGETWYVVMTEPRDGDNDDIVFLAAPVDHPVLSASEEFKLGSEDYVWEANPDDLSSGAEHFRVREGKSLRSLISPEPIKLTETQFRGLIKRLLNENSAAPPVLKNASTSVIQAINDADPSAFWNAYSEVLEGLAGAVKLAPGTDNAQAQNFIEVIKPAWNAARKLTMSHRSNKGQL